MTEHFHIPGAWDPTESLLGRLVRRLDADRLRADTTFYVLAVTAVFAFLVVTFLGWAWINRNGAPSEGEITRYWTLQAAGLAAVVLSAWAGRRPATRVTITDDGVRIRSRNTDSFLARRDIREVSRIPSLTFHQHYRRYARTVFYHGRTPTTMVLLETPSHPVILGIRPEEQAVFLDRITGWVQQRASEEHRVA